MHSTLASSEKKTVLRGCVKQTLWDMCFAGPTKSSQWSGKCVIPALWGEYICGTGAETNAPLQQTAHHLNNLETVARTKNVLMKSLSGKGKIYALLSTENKCSATGTMTYSCADNSPKLEIAATIAGLGPSIDMYCTPSGKNSGGKCTSAKSHPKDGPCNMLLVVVMGYHC